MCENREEKQQVPADPRQNPRSQRGPEGRPLNVSPAREGWVGIPIMIPPAPARRGSAIGVWHPSLTHPL